MEIKFQHENLIAHVYTESNVTVQKCVGTVPDLICMLDLESYQPVLTENYRCRLRVPTFYLPAHPLLKTPHVLKQVGPEGFKYEEIEVVPFPNEYVDPTCVISN